MNRISNYNELISEQLRIEGVIEVQQQQLKDDYNELKDKFSPFLNLLPLLNFFKSKPSNNSLLSVGTSLGIDLLVGQRLLAKSGWLLRLVIPMMLRKVSSRIIGGKGD
jgi:hypothetical protein